jgi:hypothetical protein
MKDIVSVPFTRPPTPWASLPNSFDPDISHVCRYILRMFEELAIFELFAGGFVSDCVCIVVQSMWMDVFGVVGILPFHYLVNRAGVSSVVEACVRPILLRWLGCQ